MLLDGVYDNTDNKSRELYKKGELMAFCVRNLFPQECLKDSPTKFPFPLFAFGHFPDVNTKERSVTDDFICDTCGKPFILEKGCVIKSVDSSEHCNPHMSMIYICATCNTGENDDK